MKHLLLAAALCSLLLVPTMGAAPNVQQEAADRDLTAHDAALQDVTTKAGVWSDKVAASDAARDAYDAALAALNAALDEESAARGEYETAQQAYADAYDAVPKEDSLAP